MAKKLKSVLESSGEVINDLDDLMRMQEPKFVGKGTDIFESEDEDDDDKETLKEDDDSKDEDDVIKEAKKIMAKRKAKLKEDDDSEDERKDKINIDEDEFNALGSKITNQGKSGTSNELDPSKDEKDANIFEDIENIIKSKDEDSADIFESEDEDDDDKETLKEKKKSKLKEAEDDDSKDEDDVIKEAKKIMAKRKAKLKEADGDNDEDDKLKEKQNPDGTNSKTDWDGKLKEKKKAKIKEADGDEYEDDWDEKDKEDFLDESKTLSDKEQKLVLEALNIPASAKNEVKTIFESMVANKLRSEKKRIANRFQKKLEEERANLIESLDLYAKEEVRKWKEENKPIFESKARMKKLEEGFNAMSKMFKELGFDTVLSESVIGNKYSTLIKEHKAVLERNNKLESIVENINVKQLYENATVGLSRNQARRFASLAESLEFDNVKDLNEKLKTLRKLFTEQKKYESEELDVDNSKVNESDEDNDDGNILVKEETADDLVSESLKILSK
jgi:hypothetical protein